MKSEILIIFFLMVFALKSKVVNCQTDPFKPQQLNITPATPNSAALGKFGEYPVDFTSGLINISIPLYNIKSSKLSLPISLRYHASGIKPGDQASCVGVGWALEAGGMISRSVRDKIDEFNGYLTTYSNIIPGSTPINPDAVQSDFDYVQSFLEPNTMITDGQPDIFSYTLLNKNGQFFFNSDKSTIITIPYDKVSITKGTNLISFTIVDTDGTTYIFGKSLGGDSYTESANTRTGIGDNEQSITSSWLLTTIISADKTDTITFTYTSDVIGYDYAINDNVEIWNENSLNPSQAFYSKGGMHLPRTSVSHFSGNQLTLEQITFRNGKVVFEKSTRSDYNGKKVNRISVYNLDANSNTYSKIKSIDFYYSYFPSYQRLKLDKVSINDLADQAIQNYTFAYNTTTIPPSSLTRGIDYWGYYNGSNSNTVLIPNTILNNGASGPFSAGTCNREPDLGSAQSCILTSIGYPTGGHTDFFYELNRYTETNIGDKYAGGLRIQQVKSYDAGVSSPIVKTYTYGANETGTGILVTPINSSQFFTTNYWLKHEDVTGTTPNEQVKVNNFNSSPTIGLTGLDGRIVYYDCVTEYNGTQTNNIGKTVYKFDYTPDAFIYYMPFNGITFRQIYGWKRGHLLEKTVFSTYGIPITKQVNGYGQIKQQWYGDIGYIVNEKFHFDGQSLIGGGSCGNCTPPALAGMYDYHIFSVETGNYKPINTTEYTYDQKDPGKFQTKYTIYNYDPNIYELAKITNYTNDGYEVTNFTYPLNYNSNITTSDAFINGIKNLTSLNDLTRVVETYKNKYKSDNTLVGTLEGVLTQFKSDAPYPEIVYKLERTAPKTNFTASAISGTVFTKDAGYKTELQFSGYLNGNLVQQQIANDVAKAYIWDYNNTLPIAEAINSSSTDIAYTSFESNGNGNWSGIAAGNILTTLSGYTGAKAYNFSGTTLNKAGLTSSTTYVVSYWSNVSSSYSVSGTALSGWPKNVKSVPLNGTTWYLWEHRVKNATSITVSGSGYIDELRLHPLNAQMSTYTHTPLIGVRSITDINNVTTYYDYDAMGRLSVIKDFKGNILKTYSYKYQSTTP